jgi:hypothetical protein
MGAQGVELRKVIVLPLLVGVPVDVSAEMPGGGMVGLDGSGM